ncbi:MAG: HAD-IA family hydrolase [Bacteroidales bacterium]|jgi:HAD superfamily hydrolase (TIGR01509 family)|nr:HAD-IA family hydrolase [Bacteroidales bacterium]
MKRKAPKAVLFDMDGVLIHSMPMHVAAWSKIYKEYGIEVTEEYLYSEEGRVATKAIAKLFKEQKGIELSDEETLKIYTQKANDVKSQARPPRMEGMLEFVQLVKETSATSVVTGSGQPTLMNTLNDYYPECFDEKMMISARDVKHGKPHPEPYLMGLEKHGVNAEEAIVVENAPLGTLAGHAAGIFVLAINSGKLTDEQLYENGADVVVSSAEKLADWWKSNIQ